MESQVNYRSGDIRKFFVTKNRETKTKIIYNVNVSGQMTNVTDNKDVDKIPHETLTKALRLALPFGLLILKLVPKDVKIDDGYLKRRQIMNDVNFVDYECVGFEIKGDDDKEEIQLTIRKKIIMGKTVEVKTCFVKTVGKSPFDLSGNLRDAVDDIIEEVYGYLEGKTAGVEQASIFDEPNEEEEESEETEEEEDTNEAF